MMEKLSERVSDFAASDHKYGSRFWAEATQLLKESAHELENENIADPSWFEAMVMGFMHLKKWSRTQKGARKLILLLKWTAQQLKQVGK